MATLGGIFLGLAIVLVVAIRDDRFISVVEVSERYGDAIVGQVPEVSGASRDSSLPLLKIDDDRHIYVEAFRSLRSALFFGNANGERPRLLLITSAVPDEGKSTIAANLARTLALGGSRVVLVDADVRRGGLHLLMGLQRKPGLGEFLRQEADLEKIIQADSLPGLFFIARGSNLNNPGDFFLGRKLDELLARLRQQFDYVLIDSCPVFAADDATTLAPKVDGTLLVVRSDFSSAHAVQRALELLSQRKARVLGMIFNRANASARTYYYYKYEQYHHSTPD
jgi:capsular exopolysaccharide synthesis family protein